MSVFRRIASICGLGPLRGEDAQTLAEPDGLDKIEADHVDTIWQLLTRHELLVNLPFPIVLTAPVHLARDYRLRPLQNLGFAEASLHDVCVRTPSDPRQPLASGHDKIRAMLRRRLQQACERESAVDTEVIGPEAMDHLIHVARPGIDPRILPRQAPVLLATRVYCGVAR